MREYRSKKQISLSPKDCCFFNICFYLCATRNMVTFFRITAADAIYAAYLFYNYTTVSSNKKGTRNGFRLLLP